MDKIVASIDGLKIDAQIKEHLELTYADYQKYIEEVCKFDSKTMKRYLKILKRNELLNNQETELEDPFLMELYLQHQRKDSIEIVTGFLEDDIITLDEVKKIHRVVIKGSSDDISENYGYRTDNDKWVGGFGTNGDRLVDYYPPNYREIQDLMNYVLTIFNDDTSTHELNHLFVKPFVIHGLIAYIQPFGNGNTRVSRVLQHGKIWQMTNSTFDINLSLPVLYLSKNYLLTRQQYRKLITQIATRQDWNAWLEYNLNMVDEQLYYSGSKLEKVKRMF